MNRSQRQAKSFLKSAEKSVKKYKKKNTSKFFDDTMDGLLEAAAIEFQNREEDEKVKEIELARCPICGEEVRFSYAENMYYEEPDNIIFCNNCDLTFRGSYDGLTQEQLAEEWNNRVPINEIVAELKECEKDARAEWNSMDEESAFGEMCAYSHAIEIVKGGV